MDMGMTELALVALLGVIFLGPKEMSRIAHTAGGWMREIRKMSREFMNELTREAKEEERRERMAAWNQPAESAEEFRDEDMQAPDDPYAEAYAEEHSVEPGAHAEMHPATEDEVISDDLPPTVEGGVVDEPHFCEGADEAPAETESESEAQPVAAAGEADEPETAEEQVRPEA